MEGHAVGAMQWCYAVRDHALEGHAVGAMQWGICNEGPCIGEPCSWGYAVRDHALGPNFAWVLGEMYLPSLTRFWIENMWVEWRREAQGINN